MKAVCTICSKEKVKSEGLMPARQRYTAARIERAAAEAKKGRKRFFILSGLFGLIEADYKIPYYDYPLEQKAVPQLARRVAAQFGQYNITELVLYTEGEKESSAPYEEVLERAAKEARAIFSKQDLA